MEYSLADLERFILALYATQDYPEPTLYKAPFGYPIAVTGLAQSASTTQTLSITGNADFLLLDVFYRPQIAAAQTVSTKTAAFIRMLVVDAGTNEQWTNTTVDLENYANNGNSGRKVLPYPRLIQGKTALTITFTNWAPTAETYSFEVFLSGVQVKVMNQGLPAAQLRAMRGG